MTKRIYTLAKELGLSNQEVFLRAQKLRIPVTSVSSGVTEAEEAVLIHSLRPPKGKKAPLKVVVKKAPAPREAPRRLEVRSFNAAYEKKPKKKTAPPQVKAVSRRRANGFFILLLILLSSGIFGMGALGIVSDLRVAKLIKDTNQSLHSLHQENQSEAQRLSQLEKSGKP